MKSSLPQRLWRANRVFWQFSIVLLLAAGCLLAFVHFLPKMFNAQYAFILRNARVLLCLRLSVIGLLWLYWPELIEWIDNKRQWSAEKLQHWQNARHHFIGWLLIFELLVCENILSSFIKLL